MKPATLTQHRLLLPSSVPGQACIRANRPLRLFSDSREEPPFGEIASDFRSLSRSWVGGLLGSGSGREGQLKYSDGLSPSV